MVKDIQLRKERMDPNNRSLNSMYLVQKVQKGIVFLKEQLMLKQEQESGRGIGNSQKWKLQLQS